MTELLLINSNRQKRSGNDASFSVDLGSSCRFKRFMLSSFSAQNLYSNFVGKYSDFSFQTANGEIHQLKCDRYLTRLTFIQWFNDSQSVLTLSAVPVEPYRYVMSFQDDNIEWRPVGLGWDRLGFDTSSTDYDYIATGRWVYDFGQSPILQIRLDNLSASVNNAYDQCHFIVNNSSAFGGLVQQQWSTDTGQMVYLPTEVQRSTLDITILDCEGQVFNTIGDGNNE